MKHSIITAAVALLAMATTASGQTITYGAYDGSQSLYEYGTGKKENYDVAIHIKDAGLVGKTITGINLPFDATNHISDASVFLTKELTLDNKVNKADIESKTITPAEGFTTITFDTPYTITEEGVYVGYSVTLDTAAVKPIIAVAATDPEFFYMHTSRTYRTWRSQAAATGYNLAMQVIIDGVPADAATLETEEINTQINTPTDFTFTLKNQGSSAISSIDYSYSVAGSDYQGHADLAEPLAASFNKSTELTFALPNFTEAGTFPLKLSIDKVNGNANTASVTSAESNVNVYKVLPNHKPLLEEYTGTGCGWCPRGLVALDELAKLYGSDFVAVSYHMYNGSDPMYYRGAYTNNVEGFPDAWFDRYLETDAYCGGNYDGNFNVPTVWESLHKVLAPASMGVRAVVNPDESSIDVTTAVSFPLEVTDGQYYLSYIITEDSMVGEGDSWKQANYYPGSSSTYPNENMAYWTADDAADYMPWVYNDVVITASERGTELPAAMPAEVVLSFSKTLSYAGYSVVQDYNKLNVVVALVDASTGHVVNSDKARVVTVAGIKGVDTGDETLSATATYYSLDGKRLSTPAKGVNIVRMSNGKTFKAVVK